MKTKYILSLATTTGLGSNHKRITVVVMVIRTNTTGLFSRSLTTTFVEQKVQVWIVNIPLKFNTTYLGFHTDSSDLGPGGVVVRLVSPR